MTVFWACAQTHVRQEELALVNLRRQKFIPFFPIFLIRNKNSHFISRAAFPGYIFIRLDDEYRNWAPINFTMGIQRLLTYPVNRHDEEAYRKPCRVGFIEDLYRMRILRDDEQYQPDLIPAGTTIKITNGPFADKEALVEMSSEQRVHVLLSLFNQQINVSLTVESVERISRPSV